MNCIRAVPELYPKICSENFEWLLVILILPKNKLVHRYQKILSLIGKVTATGLEPTTT